MDSSTQDIQGRDGASHYKQEESQWNKGAQYSNIDRSKVGSFIEKTLCI
jgi:hypothetical protein